MNGAAPANGYPREAYAVGQPSAPQAPGYQPVPGYAPASQADQAQPGYWDQEQQARGNWS